MATQPPAIANVSLHPYQLEGVAWLFAAFSSRINPILADDMGLGKTLQTITLIEHLRTTTGCHQPCLVVCPLSITDNWRQEFERFAPHLRVITFVGDKEARASMRTIISDVSGKAPAPSADGSDTDDGDISDDDAKSRRKSTRRTLCALPPTHRAVHRFESNTFCPFDVIITSYETVLSEFPALQSRAYLALIVDEAARLKNAKSALFRHLSVIWSQHRLLLTGTPLQNNYNELFALLQFTDIGVFNPAREHNFATYFSYQKDTLKSAERVAQLQRILAPRMLRRLKSDVLGDLPEKKEVYLYVDMTDLQRTFYLCTPL